MNVQYDNSFDTGFAPQYTYSARKFFTPSQRYEKKQWLIRVICSEIAMYVHLKQRFKGSEYVMKEARLDESWDFNAMDWISHYQPEWHMSTN